MGGRVDHYFVVGVAAFVGQGRGEVDLALKAVSDEFPHFVVLGEDEVLALGEVGARYFKPRLWECHIK